MNTNTPQQLDEAEHQQHVVHIDRKVYQLVQTTEVRYAPVPAKKSRIRTTAFACILAGFIAGASNQVLVIIGDGNNTQQQSPSAPEKPPPKVIKKSLPAQSKRPCYKHKPKSNKKVLS